MAKAPFEMSRADFIRAVDAVIRARRSRKILAGAVLDWEDAVEPAGAMREAFEQQVREAVAVAGWAPFHYSQAAQTGVPEPWRFHVLTQAAIADVLAGPLAGDTSKLPRMMQAAGVVVLATWLRESGEGEAVALRNEEHLAAAAAAVQNLLLAAEARGMGTYWSSGGALRGDAVRAMVGMGAAERFVGAIFLGAALPPDREASEGLPGANRAKRTPAEAWSRWLGRLAR